jgi:hypothetical protein
MKLAIAFSTLLLSVALVRADFVIEQKIESAMINGALVYKIKGDNARVDMPNPLGGKTTTIINGATGDMTTLMEAQKMAMKMNLKDIQKAAAAAAQPDLSALAPKPTGEKEKVGEWNTEIYEVKVGETTVKMWVAKDFPNGKAIREAMSKTAKSMAGGGFDPSKFEVPGMTVKTEAGTPIGKMVTTLLSVKEEVIPESEFVVPPGYTTMPAPTGLGQ